MSEKRTGGAVSRRELIAASAAASAIAMPTGARAAQTRPPASLAACGSGAVTNVMSFGAKADGRSDDLPAILRALEHLARQSPVPPRGEEFFVPSSTLYFPPGRYFLSRTLSLKQQVRLLGESRGNGLGSATALIFPPNVTGILINRHNTSGLTGSGPTTTSAEGSVIEGISVQAAGRPSPTSPATGIYARARCTLISCEAKYFARDGIALVADEAGDLLGNCNQSALRDCAVQGNGRHGLWLFGDNSNACIIENLDATANGGYGFCDATTVGQTWIGGHSATNGKLDSGPFRRTSLVWYRGATYALLPGLGHSVRGSTTPPDRDPDLWSLREKVGTPFYNIPEWRRGIELIEGGAGYIGGGRHVHLNPYTEGRQGPYFNNGAIAIGGSPGAGFVGRGINVYASEGRLQALNGDDRGIARALQQARQMLSRLLNG
jgi:hypothetical protein